MGLTLSRAAAEVASSPLLTTGGANIINNKFIVSTVVSLAMVAIIVFVGVDIVKIAKEGFKPIRILGLIAGALAIAAILFWVGNGGLEAFGQNGSNVLKTVTNGN